MSASTTKTKNQPSRKPVLLDYLKAFTKDKLIFAARQLCITYSKLKKDELAEKICTEMQKPEIAAKRFAIMPDENIQAFEAALEKKCFHPTYSEYALLLPFISMGYIVSYPDDCFEAVKEARTVYKKINTADFQARRQQLAWLLDCITAMSSLHLILPVEFFCEMYNQKAGFELTPETLPQLLAEVPSNFNPCAIKDGRILLKKNDSDDFYTRLEQGRKPFGLYKPTVKEITMLSHYGYMQSTTAYQDLHDFFTQELNVAALDAHYWCQYIYEFENSNTDGNTSELIQKLQANIPAWNNYSHLGRLSVLLQNARNNATRMFCLGGHTPNETIKLLRDA